MINAFDLVAVKVASGQEYQPMKSFTIFSTLWRLVVTATLLGSLLACESKHTQSAPNTNFKDPAKQNNATPPTTTQTTHATTVHASDTSGTTPGTGAGSGHKTDGASPMADPAEALQGPNGSAPAFMVENATTRVPTPQATGRFKLTFELTGLSPKAGTTGTPSNVTAVQKIAILDPSNTDKPCEMSVESAEADSPTALKIISDVALADLAPFCEKLAQNNLTPLLEASPLTLQLSNVKYANNTAVTSVQLLINKGNLKLDREAPPTTITAPGSTPSTLSPTQQLAPVQRLATMPAPNPLPPAAAPTTGGGAVVPPPVTTGNSTPAASGGASSGGAPTAGAGPSAAAPAAAPAPAPVPPAAAPAGGNSSPNSLDGLFPSDNGTPADGTHNDTAGGSSSGATTTNGGSGGGLDLYDPSDATVGALATSGAAPATAANKDSVNADSTSGYTSTKAEIHIKEPNPNVSPNANQTDGSKLQIAFGVSNINAAATVPKLNSLFSSIASVSFSKKGAAEELCAPDVAGLVSTTQIPLQLKLQKTLGIHADTQSDQDKCSGFGKSLASLLDDDILLVHLKDITFADNSKRSELVLEITIKNLTRRFLLHIGSMDLAADKIGSQFDAVLLSEQQRVQAANPNLTVPADVSSLIELDAQQKNDLLSLVEVSEEQGALSNDRDRLCLSLVKQGQADLRKTSAAGTDPSQVDVIQNTDADLISKALDECSGDLPNGPIKFKDCQTYFKNPAANDPYKLGKMAIPDYVEATYLAKYVLHQCGFPNYELHYTVSSGHVSEAHRFYRFSKEYPNVKMDPYFKDLPPAPVVPPTRRTAAVTNPRKP